MFILLMRILTTLAFISVVFFGGIIACEKDSQQIENPLKVAGIRYLAFMNRVGVALDEDQYVGDIPVLFSPHLKKEENTKVLFDTREGLPKQLRDARKFAGYWTIKTISVVPNPEDSSCRVHFSWESSKVGLYETKAVLKFDAQMLITQIIEDYGKVADVRG